MKKLCVYVMFFCVLLAGCGKKEEAQEENSVNIICENEEKSENTQTYEFPEEYIYESEGNVTFKTEIIVDNQYDKNIFYKGNAVLQQIDADGLQQLLFDDMEKVHYHTMESTDFVGNKGISQIWQTDSGKTLYTSTSLTTFTTPLYHHVSQAFSIPRHTDEKTVYSTEEEFEGFTRKEAYKELETLFNGNGIELLEEYVCYTLPYNIMKEKEEAFNKEGMADNAAKKKEWTEQDDTYFFFFQSRFCGLPTYHPYVYKITEDSLEYAPVQAAVSRSGIIYIGIERAFNYTTQKEAVILLPFEDIATAVKNELNQILGEQKYIVKRAELKAMENMTGKISYEMLPIWVLTIEAQNSQGIREYQMFYNACTAEAILF